MADSAKSYVVDEDGRRTAVILPIEEYRELMEDLGDLATIAERRDEPAESLNTVIYRIERKWNDTTEQR